MRKPPPDTPDVLLATVRDGVLLAARASGIATPSICVAYSGGLDSSVLLHVLADTVQRSGTRLSALHVHHGLSPNADAWAAHCVAACRRLEVPLRVERVTVTRKPRQSLEEVARRARYMVLNSAGTDVLALAHHADDQAETVLLQLLRGAGPQGLAAMPVIKKDSDAAGAPLLLRPLLAVTRERLEHHAKSHGISWIEDESNDSHDIKRNFLRHRIMPLLAQGFPAPGITLARAARHQSGAAQLLDDLSAMDLAAVSDESAIDCVRLQALTRLRQANLMRGWLRRHGARQPSEARLRALLVAVAASTNDSRLKWVHENLAVTRFGGKLMIACEGRSGT